MIRHCQKCGEEIPRNGMSVNNKKYQSKKFCSAKCHHEFMKKEFEYKCAECGEKVIRKKDNIATNVFCDNVCKGKYAGKHYSTSTKGKKVRDRVNKVCGNCNEPYEVIKSRSDKSRYCSLKCKVEANVKTSPSTQTNRVEIKCDNCEIKFEKVLSDIKQLNFCSIECMHEFYGKTSMFAGENSGTWKGGDEDYRGANWYKQRELTRERDKYTCQKCGIKESECKQELSVHHVTPYRYFNNNYTEANKLDNLMSLCNSCHSSVHSKEYEGTRFLNIPENGIIECGIFKRGELVACTSTNECDTK